MTLKSSSSIVAIRDEDEGSHVSCSLFVDSLHEHTSFHLIVYINPQKTLFSTAHIYRSAIARHAKQNLCYSIHIRDHNGWTTNSNYKEWVKAYTFISGIRSISSFVEFVNNLFVEFFTSL
ncbi:hypothetical protein Scep_021530 [Stephania cephalantha]|uniref:Uncharacterized protein n=1 Tax=Stephania cephalantha TaxID=152367 RepID=A0AAP0I1H3_9MAGN